ncbi:hypothetical protein TNCV_2753951 [Trichonephila clavipes]|nr:hypothetical protein TNCV_2753951 [Trichonephila clavipes]
MSDSESEVELMKSYRSGSTMSTKSGSTAGLPISDCERRRRTIKSIEAMEFEISAHQKMIEINRTIGDKTMIPQIEQLLKKRHEEKEFKRKTDKEDSEGFAFPKKTARPITPTKVLEPLQTQNNFETLTQDPEPVINLTNEKDSPKPRAPNPITLKVNKNYREQIKMINETFPDIQIKSAGEYFKLFPNNDDESRSLTHFLESDNQYEFYIIPPKENKPLKVVIKGLPRVTLPEEITLDLEELGFTVTNCN